MSRVDDLLRTTPHVAYGYAERLDPEGLAAALARVLHEYSAYAGRLREHRGALWLEHGVGGAAFDVVRSRESIASLRGRANGGSMRAVCPPISVLSAPRGKEPLLAVRVTEAQDGTIVGVTWYHSVGDFQSVMMLLRAWSLAYRGKPYDRPFEVPDRDAYLSEHVPDPETALPAARVVPVREWLRLVTTLATQRTRRVDLEFRRDTLDALVRQVGHERSVTRNDALCGHVCSVLRQLRGAQGASEFMMAVNYRKRVGLPANFLGNPLSIFSQRVEDGDGLAEIATHVRARIDEFLDKHIDHGATVRFAERHPRPGQRMRFVMRGYDAHSGNLLVSNWTGFGLYDLKFGTQQPRFVCCRASDLTWFATIHDRSVGDGSVVFSVALPEALADRLTGPEGRALLYASPETALAPPRVSGSAASSA